MLSSDPGAARALLTGRMAQDGERPLAELPLSGGALGGTGALAVGPRRLWLAQPQLLGGPSVASVALSQVGAGGFRARAGFLGGCRLTLEIDGRAVTFTTPAPAAEVAGFLSAVEDARG